MSAIKKTKERKKSISGQPDALAGENLARPCDPAALGFSSTDELPTLRDVIGQPRAFRVLELGSEVRGIGYNIFVLGIPDSGRTTLTRDYFQRKAVCRPVPDDWVFFQVEKAEAMPHRCAGQSQGHI